MVAGQRSVGGSSLRQSEHMAGLPARRDSAPSALSHSDSAEAAVAEEPADESFTQQLQDKEEPTQLQQQEQRAADAHTHALLQQLIDKIASLDKQLRQQGAELVLGTRVGSDSQLAAPLTGECKQDI